MLVNITQCYVCFSCTEKWICCTYDFTLFWLSLYLTSPSSQFPLWILCFCPIFLHWGSPIFPSPSTPSPLGRLSNHRQSNALRTLWDTLLTLACPSPLNSRLMCWAVHSLSLCGWLLHASPVSTECLIQPHSHSQVDSVLSENHLRFVRFCSVQSSWSSFFHICSNPHFKRDQLYCPHLCTESEPCGCLLLRLWTCLLIGCLASAWDPTQQEGGFWKVILMLNTVRVIFYSLSSSSWITQNRNLRTLVPLSTQLSLHPFPASSGHCCLLLILKHVSQAPHSVLALVFSSGVCRARHSAYVQDSFLLFLCI